MKKNNWKLYLSRSLSALLLLLMCTSCTPQLMFQEKEDSTLDTSAPLSKKIPEHILRSGDKITLSVWGHEELGVGSTFSVYNSTVESGKYIILDEKGEVDLPLIGKLKLEELTVREANLLLEGRYGKFLHEPIIRLRVLSRKATVLGEVNSPGNYELPSADYSLFEMIGDAAGFSEYADLRNITIIRKSGDIQEKRVLDLTDKETIYLEDLTLRDKDLIYVPERRAKEVDKMTSRLVPIAGLIGSAVLLISIIKK